MAAYLIADVDDLLRFTAQNGIDLHELAVALRGGAGFVAGLYDTTALKSVAVADWRSQQRDESLPLEPEAIFRSAGYQVIDARDRSCLPDCLVQDVFQLDPNPIEELILATTGADLLPLIDRVNVTDIESASGATMRAWFARLAYPAMSSSSRWLACTASKAKTFGSTLISRTSPSASTNRDSSSISIT